MNWKFNFDVVRNFREERAVVILNNKQGHVDIDGKIITPIIYDNASNFYRGMAAIELNDKWGYVNRDGKVVTPIIYDFVSSFIKEKKGIVGIGGMRGVIDRRGRVIEGWHDLIRGVFNE